MTTGQCPECLQEAHVSEKTGRILAHSVPRWKYRDRRGCRGQGRVPVKGTVTK